VRRKKEFLPTLAKELATVIAANETKRYFAFSSQSVMASLSMHAKRTNNNCDNWLAQNCL